MRPAPREIDLETGPPFTLSVADFAQVLGVGVRQARQFIAEGRVYSFRCGRRVLVSKASARRLLAGELDAPVADASRPPLRVIG